MINAVKGTAKYVNHVMPEAGGARQMTRDMIMTAVFMIARQQTRYAKVSKC